MSGGGAETPVACDAAQGGGGKKRDSLGTTGAAHLIIKGTEWRAWSSVRGVGSVLGTAPPGAPRLSRRLLLPGLPQAERSQLALLTHVQWAKGAQVENGTSLSPTQSCSRVTSVLHPLVLCPLRLDHARKRGHLGKRPKTRHSEPYSVPI